MNSRAKGAAAERELANLFSEYLGMTIKRKLGAPRDGGDDLEIGPYSVECKRSERLLIQEWWRQCTKNAGDQKPLLCFRQSRGEWLCTMRLTDFIEIAREEIVDA